MNVKEKQLLLQYIYKIENLRFKGNKLHNW